MGEKKRKDDLEFKRTKMESLRLEIRDKESELYRLQEDVNDNKERHSSGMTPINALVYIVVMALLILSIIYLANEFTLNYGD